MKKSLIALAALATVATAAQAQSSVTVYGVIDMGYASVSGVALNGNASTNTAAGQPTGRVSGLQNGGLSTSRLGFRGTEDLGGGLAANFALEAEILADTGAQTSTPEALFARASWVGLSSKDLGSVQLGRMNHFTYDTAISGDAFGANNLGGFVAANNGFYARIENAVTYKTPVINGFQAGVQSGTRTAFNLNGSVPTTGVYGEVAGKTSGNRVNGLLATYNNGPLELGAAFGNLKEETGVKLSEVTNAFARYNFGPVKLFTGWSEQKNNRDRLASTTTGATDNTSSTSAVKVTSYYLGATAPVGAKTTLMANVIQVKVDRKAAVTQEPTVFALGAKYDLSKRTSLYALYAKSEQDNGSTQRIVNAGKFNYAAADDGAYTAGNGPVAGVNQNAYMVGIRHSF